MHSDELPVKQWCLPMLAAHNENKLSICWLTKWGTKAYKTQTYKQLQKCKESQYMQSGPIISLRFNGHFPDVSGLAGTRTSPCWILLQLRMMEVWWAVTTGAISRTKLQIVTTNKPTPSFFTGRMSFLSPKQQCRSTEGKKSLGHTSCILPSTQLTLISILQYTNSGLGKK